MFGKLNEEDIEALLKRQVIGRIGCHADNTTFIVPISYAYDDGCIYVHTKEGLKINLMRKNPSVCFEVDEMKDMANWKTVIAWGEFEELKEPEERNKGLMHLVNRLLPMVSSETTHLFPDWPFTSDDISVIKGIVFRIRLTRKTGRYESNYASPCLNG